MRILNLTEAPFVVPSGHNGRSLNSKDVEAMLVGASKGGSKQLLVLFLICLAAALTAIIGYDNFEIGILAGALALCMFLGVLFQRSKAHLPVILAAQPGDVTWAHPMVICLNHNQLVEDGVNHLKAHFKNGSVLEMALPREQMIDLFVWLKQQSPDVRLNGW